MATKKTKPKATLKRGHYDPALKREIARRYLDNDFSYGVAAEAYGLPSKDVVKEFVRWYKRERAAEDAALAERTAELAAGPRLLAARDAEAPMPDDPAALKRLLRDARDEATVWRTLVRVAEEQTGVPILKKPIAKPPVR